MAEVDLEKASKGVKVSIEAKENYNNSKPGRGQPPLNLINE